MRRVRRGDVEWLDGPARHEAGTPNVVGAVAMATALDELAATGFDVIGDHEQRLTAELRDGLASIDGLTVHRFFHDDLPTADEEVGIVAFDVAAHDAALVAAALSAEHGVGLRDGGFCAHVAIDRLQGGDGTGPVRGLLRASVGVGSRAADVTRARRRARGHRRRRPALALRGRRRPAATGRRPATRGPVSGAGGRRLCEPDDMASEEIDQYLAGLDERSRTALEQLRTSILAVVPDAEPGLAYGAPAFRSAGGGKVVAGFSASKAHLSYLPHSGSVLADVADAVTGYETTKGALHFSADEPLPDDLVRTLVTARLRELGLG